MGFDVMWMLIDGGLVEKRMRLLRSTGSDGWRVVGESRYARLRRRESRWRPSCYYGDRATVPYVRMSSKHTKKAASEN